MALSILSEQTDQNLMAMEEELKYVAAALLCNFSVSPCQMSPSWPRVQAYRVKPMVHTTSYTIDVDEEIVEE